ncbi:MAG: endolytic transglycosylase MltG, partial [OM182 bacterium]
MLLCAAAAYLLSPPSHLPSAKSEPTLLPIARGSSFKAIAANLEEAGVIRSALVFEILALIRGERSLLKSGEYEFPQGKSASDVLGDLVAGRVKSYQITFVEGWTLERCLEALAASPGLIKTLNGIDDPGLIAFLQQGISSAEGFFDVNTFRYVRGDTDLDRLQSAQKQLAEKLADDWNHRSQDLPL